MCRCFNIKLCFQCLLRRGFCPTQLSALKGEPEGVMAALVETGKPTSCQLPKESADGASPAVHTSEAAPELTEVLGNILAILCQTEPCRVATILLDLNLDEDKFQ